MKKRALGLISIIISSSTTINKADSLSIETIPGKVQFKTRPFKTPGDRVYVIGAQDGTFPKIGWHIHGEMGVVWNYPIKLLDGYLVLEITYDLHGRKRDIHNRQHARCVIMEIPVI